MNTIGLNLFTRDVFGCTALHLSSFENPQVLKHLVMLGMHVNAADNDIQTPLFFACQYGQLENVKYLIAKGSDVNFLDKDGTLFYVFIYVILLHFYFIGF